VNLLHDHDPIVEQQLPADRDAERHEQQAPPRHHAPARTPTDASPQHASPDATTPAAARPVWVPMSNAPRMRERRGRQKSE
jgi:hypothetical protein